jgi:hypothetical protein
MVFARFITLDPNPASPLCPDVFFRRLGGVRLGVRRLSARWDMSGSVVGTSRYDPDGMMESTGQEDR